MGGVRRLHQQDDRRPLSRLRPARHRLRRGAGHGRIAGALGMDPAEVRRRNLIPAEAFPYRAPTGRLHDSGDYVLALNRVLELAGYAGPAPTEQAEVARTRTAPRHRDRHHRRCLGVWPAGTFSVRPGYETSIVRVDQTGSVTVYTGASPHGQGHETTFAQIAADELSVPLEDVNSNLRRHSPDRLGHRHQGQPLHRRGRLGGRDGQPPSQGKCVASWPPRCCAPSRSSWSCGGAVSSPRTYPTVYVTWRDVAAYCLRSAAGAGGHVDRGLEASVFWEPDSLHLPFHRQRGRCARGPRQRRTCELLDFYSVNDFGILVNPMVVHGQVHGGLAQGIGAA